MMKILLVGGTWVTSDTYDANSRYDSSVVAKIKTAVENYQQTSDNKPINITTHNGGLYPELQTILERTKDFDIVIWMPNVPDNNLPKLRDVKSIAPKTILITSKRNDNNKYSFGEVVRRALGAKANLLIQFSKNDDGIFNMSVIDPLGNEWFNGTDISEMVSTLLQRAFTLRSITRQGTKQNDKLFSDTSFNDPDAVNTFINIVQRCGKMFNKYTPSADNTTRLLGNCSTTAPTRCSKGFPTMRRNDNVIFVSERNVDKKSLTAENFVPVKFDGTNIFYKGLHKPSVDTPIQVRLYDLLPNINYMIHSHCYIKNAPFTENCVPCGGLEEVKEIMDVIDKTLFERQTLYMAINLKGHGSIVMTNSLVLLDNIENEYCPREFPEKQYNSNHLKGEKSHRKNINQ